MKRFLKLTEIVEVTGLSRSSIYRLVEIGQFPQQVKLGSRSVAWLSTEIDDWMTNRISNR